MIRTEPLSKEEKLKLELLLKELRICPSPGQIVIDVSPEGKIGIIRPTPTLK